MNDSNLSYLVKRTLAGEFIGNQTSRKDRINETLALALPLAASCQPLVDDNIYTWGMTLQQFAAKIRELADSKYLFLLDRVFGPTTSSS